MLLAAGGLHLLLPQAWTTAGSLPAAGALLASFGFLVMLRAWWLFRRFETAICPNAETTTLITTDVYRFTRNPMYVGIVLMLLGIAVGTGGLFFYVAALAYFLTIDYAFCPYEEEKLDRTFGPAFREYRQQVRRWL
jgi:protein-S-isoprenylcysteine O-methyltransferase Ste14